MLTKFYFIRASLCSKVGSMSDSGARGRRFDTISDHLLFIFPSADSRRGLVSYWQKYLHLVLVDLLGGLSLPRNSMIRLIDGPYMTITVNCGCKATKQQQQQNFILQTSLFKIIYMTSLWQVQTNHRETQIYDIIKLLCQSL